MSVQFVTIIDTGGVSDDTKGVGGKVVQSTVNKTPLTPFPWHKVRDPNREGSRFRCDPH